MKYAAIYARSSLGKSRQGDTAENQIEIIKEFAKRSNMDVIFHDKFIFVDDGESGYKTTLLQRTSMKQLLSAIDAGLISTVFFKGVSRFARDSGESIITVKRLKNKGVRVISLEENFDSDRDDPTMFQIYAVMAEQESRKTSVRVSLSNKQKARAGLWANSTTPFGYKRVKDLENEELKNKLLQTGHHPQSLFPDENAIVVQLIFDLFVNKGYGKKKIVNVLNSKGYTTKRGNKFQEKSVSDILRNPVYVGDIVYGKSRYEYVETEDMKKKIQKTVEINEDDWAIRKNAHPPIIDRKLFEKAQQIISAKHSAFNFGKKFNAAKHPLTGILVCGKCGQPMMCQKRTNTNRNGEKKEYRYYVCSTYHKRGRLVCSQPNINANDIEKAVLQIINNQIDQIWNKINLENELQENTSNDSHIKQEISLIEKNIEKKINASKALMETREIYDTEVFIQLNTEINNEIQSLKKQKEMLKNKIKQINNAESLYNLKEDIEEYRKLEFITNSDIKQMRSLFQKVLTKVLVEDKDIKEVKMIPLY